MRSTKLDPNHVGSSIVHQRDLAIGDGLGIQCDGPDSHGDAPDLGIRVGRNRDLVARLDVRIAAPEDRPVRTEDCLVVVGAPQSGCRPADQARPPSRSRM